MAYYHYPTILRRKSINMLTSISLQKRTHCTKNEVFHEGFLQQMRQETAHLVTFTEEIFQVFEYPLKQNKNTLKTIQVLLYTHFYSISLNVLRPTFFNICNLPISHFPNIMEIRVKVGPNPNYISYFMRSCTNRIVVFNNFFHLYLANQETNKTVPAIFFFSNIF